MANEPVQLEDDAAQERAAERRASLERAKQRANQNGERPRAMTNTPNFADVRELGKQMVAPAAANTPPPSLSQATRAGLDAVAAANRERPAELEPEAAATPVELTVDDVKSRLACDLRTAIRVHDILNPDRETSAAQKQRKAVEARLQPLDIGQFLMNGVLTQSVTIVPPSDALRSGLVVVFQTVNDGVEVYVDRMLGDEVARARVLRLGDGENVRTVNAEMTEREFARRSGEFGLAVGVRSYMGNAWPSITKPNGDIDELAVQKRLVLVRQIPSAVLAMVHANLGWFLERVQSTLDVAVLGNG